MPIRYSNSKRTHNAIGFATLIVAIVIGFGCAGNHTHTAGIVNNPADFERYLDKMVTVHGVAKTYGKAGTVVLMDNRQPPLPVDMDIWPAEVESKRVSASGTLRRIEPTSNLFKQGYTGGWYRLTEFRYELAPWNRRHLQR